MPAWRLWYLFWHLPGCFLWWASPSIPSYGECWNACWLNLVECNVIATFHEHRCSFIMSAPSDWLPVRHMHSGECQSISLDLSISPLTPLQLPPSPTGPYTRCSPPQSAPSFAFTGWLLFSSPSLYFSPWPLLLLIPGPQPRLPFACPCPLSLAVCPT